VKEKYLQALNSFAKRIKNDPNIIAILLYGSLAYGDVWEKSDIDIEIIVRDGTAISANWFLFEEDEVEFEITGIVEISKFKNMLNKVRTGFDHAKYGGGYLIFSKDDALNEIFESARKIGADDAPKSFAAKISELLNWMKKAEKYASVDTLYSQRFLQLCAPIAAEMLLITHRENPNRDSILRARQLDADLMHKIYVLPSTTAMSEDDIRDALQALDNFLVKHMNWWSKHIIKFMNDGEVKTFSHILDHCGYAPMQFLAEKGVVEQVTSPARIFKKSKLTIEETSYIYLGEDA